MLETNNSIGFKKWWPLVLILFMVVIDQCIKLYVKTHFHPGQSVNLIGSWFQIYFVENNGAAFGLEFGGNIGKYILTLFRIAVTVFGFYFLFKNIKNAAKKLLLAALALILAGAIGNIIDSIFYGVLFHKINIYEGSWFQGQVVDMFYTPLIETKLPQWLPVMGGQDFTFFSPIWNFADACISIGVFTIILGQKHIFNQPQTTHPENQTNSETTVSSTEI